MQRQSSFVSPAYTSQAKLDTRPGSKPGVLKKLLHVEVFRKMESSPRHNVQTPSEDPLEVMAVQRSPAAKWCQNPSCEMQGAKKRKEQRSHCPASIQQRTCPQPKLQPWEEAKRSTSSLALSQMDTTAR